MIRVAGACEGGPGAAHLRGEGTRRGVLGRGHALAGVHGEGHAHAMAGADEAIEGWALPRQQVHPDRRGAARELAFGELDCRQPGTGARDQEIELGRRGIRVAAPERLEDVVEALAEHRCQSCPHRGVVELALGLVREEHRVLVAGRADEERDPGRRAGGKRVARVLRDRDRVEHGAEAHEARPAGAAWHREDRLHELVDRHGLQPLDVAGTHAGGLEQLRRQRGRRRRGSCARRPAPLWTTARWNSPAGRGHGEQRARPCGRRLTRRRS